METLNANTLTIVALVFWSLSALWAGFRGMIRTILSFSVIILTFIVTYFITPAAYQLLHRSAYINNFLQQRTSAVMDSLADRVGSGTGGTGWLEILPLPKEAQEVMALGNNDMIAQVIRSDSVKGFLSVQMANTIIRISVVILTAITAFILLTILRVILLKMADLSGLGGVDHFLGFIIGLIQGLVVIWIALLIIRLVALTGRGTDLMMQVRESAVLSLLDEYNMVWRFISSVITGR